MRDTFIYYFQAEFPGHTTKNHPVKVPDRPCMVVEELVDPDGTKKPGKTRWLPLRVEYFWPEEIPSEFPDICPIMVECYKIGVDAFTEARTPDELMAAVGPRLGKGTLQRYHKQSGTMIEEWHLKGLWPHTIDFGELCYSSRADVEINIVWRFFEATYTDHRKGDECPNSTEITTPTPINSISTTG